MSQLRSNFLVDSLPILVRLFVLYSSCLAVLYTFIYLCNKLLCQPTNQQVHIHNIPGKKNENDAYVYLDSD